MEKDADILLSSLGAERDSLDMLDTFATQIAGGEAIADYLDSLTPQELKTLKGRAALAGKGNVTKMLNSYINNRFASPSARLGNGTAPRDIGGNAAKFGSDTIQLQVTRTGTNILSPLPFCLFSPIGSTCTYGEAIASQLSILGITPTYAYSTNGSAGTATFSYTSGGNTDTIIVRSLGLNYLAMLDLMRSSDSIPVYGWKWNVNSSSYTNQFSTNWTIYDYSYDGSFIRSPKQIDTIDVYQQVDYTRNVGIELSLTAGNTICGNMYNAAFTQTLTFYQSPIKRNN